MSQRYKCFGVKDKMGKSSLVPIQLACLSVNQVSQVRFPAGSQGVVCLVKMTGNVSGEDNIGSVTIGKVAAYSP